jgi:Domain of unknown function (DUF4340)
VKLGRLLIAAVLLAGLGFAVWWSNKKEVTAETKPAADAAPKILTLTEGDIREVEIKRREGEDTVLKKDDSGKWSITAPKALPADQSAVGGVTSAATSLASERVVDDHATDLASYGLAPAAVEVTFKMKDGKTTKLLVGDDTPTGSNVYAKLDNDPRLFTMGSSNKSSFDKGVKDLRDKRLMTFTQDKISRVELTAKKASIEFGRVNQNEWQILKPRPLRADAFQVDDLVRKIAGANMDTSANDEELKKAAAAFNSSPMFALARVTDATGTQTLELRKSKDDYYAKSSVVEGIHKVTKDVGEGLDKALDDFRNKKLFDFGFTDPNKIEVKDGGKTSVFEKTLDKWMSAGKPLDSTSLQAFIDKLRDLSTTKFVEMGFTAPIMELTVVSNDGKRTEKVEIAPAGSNFIARRAGETSLYEIDPNVVKDLRSAAADVKPAVEPKNAKKK